MRRDKEFYKEHFANFDVDQLEELIQRDWQADGTLLNAEQVLAIAEILEEKIPSGVTDEEIEADWQSFLNDYLPLLEVDEPLTEAKGNKEQLPKHSRIAWAAGILAVFILSTSVFAFQVYGHSVWESIARWTAEIFQLKTPVTPNGDAGRRYVPKRGRSKTTTTL